MGGSQSAIKEVFNKYDLRANGHLDVSEILEISELKFSGKQINFRDCHSLVLLFMFDQSQEGGLNLKEFRRIIEFLEKKRKENQQKRGSSTPKEYYTTVNHDNRNTFDLDRDSGPQMITGKKRGSKGEPQRSSFSDLKGYSDSELVSLLREEAIKFLGDFLKKKDGQKRFTQWLWNLADIEKDRKISLKELSKLLTLLTNDGFIISTLFFDDKPRQSVSANDIMEEYDIGKTGFLAYDEFFKLADMIYRQYLHLTHIGEKQYGKYKILRKVGSGAGGTVYAALDTITQTKKALKVIPSKNLHDLSKIDSEIKAMLMLDHPNILGLEEVIETSDDDIVFVMELCDQFWLPNDNHESNSRFYFKQLVSAVTHCHERGVCHRDIKPENLLLDSECNLKVADFGQAAVYSKGWDIFSPELVGTLFYLAPEQLKNQAYSGEKADIWTLGIVLYEFLTKRPPFQGTDIDDFLDKVEKCEFQVLDSFSTELVDLLHGILRNDPAKRLSLKQIDEHPWLKGESKKPDFKSSSIVIHTHQQELRGSLLKNLSELNIHFVERDSQINCSDPSRNIKFFIKILHDKENEEFTICCNLTNGSRREFGTVTGLIRQNMLVFDFHANCKNAK